jgi:hypothetical protein
MVEGHYATLEAANRLSEFWSMNQVQNSKAWVGERLPCLVAFTGLMDRLPDLNGLSVILTASFPHLVSMLFHLLPCCTYTIFSSMDSNCILVANGGGND